ncbi:MAG: hypothetical protein ACKOB0_00565, partial [Chthoniobacterales bacterium]
AMNPHSAIDARSLDMDRLIAQRLRDNPAVLDKARSVLAKWMTSCDASVRPTSEEWARYSGRPDIGGIRRAGGRRRKIHAPAPIEFLLRHPHPSRTHGHHHGARA